MGPGPMAGPPQMAGGPQLQMNGTTASAIHALPASLPGQSSSSALTQKLAATQDADLRRTMLGEIHKNMYDRIYRIFHRFKEKCIATHDLNWQE